MSFLFNCEILIPQILLRYLDFTVSKPRRNIYKVSKPGRNIYKVSTSKKDIYQISVKPGGIFINSVNPECYQVSKPRWNIYTVNKPGRNIYKVSNLGEIFISKFRGMFIKSVNANGINQCGLSIKSVTQAGYL